MSNTEAYCRECDWSQVFKDEDSCPKAKHAAKMHVHGDCHVKQVEE